MTLPPEIQKYTQPAYWYGRANVPVHLRSPRWAELDLGGEVLSAAREVLAGWYRGHARGLALFGKPGRGKTTLLSRMVCAAVNHGLKGMPVSDLLKADPPAYFMTLREYHDLGFEQMNVEKMLDRAPGDWDTLAVEWMNLRDKRHWINGELPVLVLDDVGKEHHSRSGYTEAGFYALMRQRFNAGLATSMTSNLTQSEFLDAYGEAQLSFLAEACVVVEVDGKTDFRMARRGA